VEDIRIIYVPHERGTCCLFVLFAGTTQGRPFNSFILQLCKQRDNVGFVCVAAVISKYKLRIKDLAPLEDKHLLLVSASIPKTGVPDLNRRVKTLSCTMPCHANHCHCPST